MRSVTDGSRVPRLVLNAICTVASYVAECYERGGASLSVVSKRPAALGADDMLPVFIFAVVKARPSCPFTLAKYLYATGAPGELSGESGYYLAMFESAIAYVRDYSRSPAPARPAVENN